VITGLPPPAIVQPAPYEVSYGLVTGTAARGTERIVVRAGRRVLADRALRGRHFTLRVALPARETTVSVTTFDASGRHASSRVGHVLGLPRAGTPVLRATHLDGALQAQVRGLASRFPGTSGIYVASLTSGAGAAWNARAQLPAASTLKLGIAVVALERASGVPAPGTYLDGVLRRTLVVSDNEAANLLEVWAAGSTSSGGHAVNRLMASLGLDGTDMYGGYLREPASRGIPLRADDQPYWGRGKRTTARDLAGLLRGVWLASGGLGPLRKVAPGFTPDDARYLLYLLAHVRDTGKLEREVGARPGVQVLHKAGWINAARHDNGLVFWRGGVYVVAVMTYRAGGADRFSDVLAGRVAHVALRRFAGAA
jgi:beta-lactamase class A